MTDNWIVLEKVGKWVGLEGNTFYDYLNLANDIHREAAEEHQSDYDFDTEYYEFLNDEVISSSALVEYLSETDVSPEKLEELRNAEVDFEEIVTPRHLIDYSLDEIVDFVMILKLLREYENQTGESAIAPLEKLHYLVFLTNQWISKDDDLVRLEDRLGLKNLQRTGYRYSFQKRNGMPIAESLRRDKDRLLSWGLLNEEGLEDHQGTRFPFSISFGETGEFFFHRYGNKMSRFNSLLLKTWEEKQREVLQNFAATPPQGIQSYLGSVDRINNTKEGHVILHGRPMNFTNREDEESAQVSEVHG